jgi:hypothetical protein
MAISNRSGEMIETAISPRRKPRPDESPLEEYLDTLGESHDENAYRAIERLVQAGEQVGFTVHDLIRMLHSGMTLESMFDVIEARMVGAGIQRNPGPRQ